MANNGRSIQPNEAYATSTINGYVHGPSAPFTCPYPTCRVFALHLWGHVSQLNVIYGTGGVSARVPGKAEKIVLSQCTSCGHESVFLDGKLIFPIQSSAPPPAKDMPLNLIGDFEEARLILPQSPRGSAALLRLIVQKLLPILGATKTEINAGIGELVARSIINPQIQKALDSVRVIGNEAIHPGTMDLSDDETTALSLFKLVNFIVAKCISEPKEIEEIYGTLPENKVAGIINRDASAGIVQTVGLK